MSFWMYICFFTLLGVIFADESADNSKDDDDDDLNNAAANLTCADLQKNFAQAVSSVSHCAVENARPITLCRSCVSYYNDTLNAFEDLQDSDTSENVTCKEMFFQQDTVSVVRVVFDGISDLWIINDCDNCYAKSEGKVDYTKETTNVTNFYNSLAQFNFCLSEVESYGNAKNYCAVCSVAYSNLSNIYQEDFMYNGSESSTCRDVVDAMNRTKHLWDDIYRCSDNHFHFTQSSIGFYNILTSVLVCLSPVAFYMIARFFSVLDPVKIFEAKRRSFNQNSSNMKS